MNYLPFEKPLVELDEKIREILDDKENKLNEKELSRLRKELEKLQVQLYANLSAWQKVELSRHPDRPKTVYYVEHLCDEFIELHGDRNFSDDPSIIGGLASIGGHSVVLIGQEKGDNTKSRQHRNFGMPRPEGYRKALRLMKLAEKFGRPIVTLIDTPGAYPGIGAEERGQAEAIARNLFEMATLEVPIICIVIGEGASGGAIGIGVGDRVFMLENTWYSVISPESCSSILWHNWDNKKVAAENLKLTANDMLANGLIDGIVPEPLGGAHRNPEAMVDEMRKVIGENLQELGKVKKADRLKQRIEKYESIGKYEEVKAKR